MAPRASRVEDLGLRRLAPPWVVSDVRWPSILVRLVTGMVGIEKLENRRWFERNRVNGR